MQRLKELADPQALEGMARFGIRTQKAYGISAPALRRLAKEIGKDHALSERLWKSSILEGRILASLIDGPQQVSEAQMERWTKDFDNWAICDACCGNLFRKTIFAYKKAREWSNRQEEFVKRAGFVLMADLAVHDKQASNEAFIGFLSIIKREAGDQRNFVRKAVNWALRQIGKRNRNLNQLAIATAKGIQRMGTPSARWIAADAIRELQSPTVQKRVIKKDLRSG